jgi:hypothetical protein
MSATIIQAMVNAGLSRRRRSGLASYRNGLPAAKGLAGSPWPLLCVVG